MRYGNKNNIFVDASAINSSANFQLYTHMASRGEQIKFRGFDKNYTKKISVKRLSKYLQ